jgi:hypothetical protein
VGGESFGVLLEENRLLQEGHDSILTLTLPLELGLCL